MCDPAKREVRTTRNVKGILGVHGDGVERIEREERWNSMPEFERTIKRTREKIYWLSEIETNRHKRFW
jgi:hypothetical protein